MLHTLNFRLFAEQIAYIVNHAEDVVIFAEGSLVNLLVRISHAPPLCAPIGAARIVLPYSLTHTLCAYRSRCTRPAACPP